MPSKPHLPLPKDKNMRHYPQNSPQARARVLAMCLLADSDLDDEELSRLREQDIYHLIDLTPLEFMQVLRDYLHDLSARLNTPEARVSMLETEQVNAMLAEITDRPSRIAVLALALSLCKGDHALNQAELVLFRHIMQQWQLDLTDLEIEVSR